MLNYIRHIAVFSKVAEEGSFTKAAQSLGIPPSRVSESVSKLEHHVGVSLFNRTTRKIALTNEGRMLFARTSGILEGVERGLNELKETKSVPMGSLRISVPTYLLSSRLMQAVGQFTAQHTQVHVSADFTDRKVDPVQDGYDMCICSGQVNGRGAMTRKLGRFERAIFAGAGYLANQPKADHPKELMKWDWVTYRHPKRSYLLVSNAGETQKLSIGGQARLQVDSIDALYSFICMDIGVAVLPEEFARRGVREKKLVRMFDDWYLPKVDYFAMWPDKSYRQGLVSVFVDFLSDYINCETQ